MKDKNYENQPPIIRFLNKHKWRIILPLLFATVYWAYPRYNYYPIAVQSELFIKSSAFSQDEIAKKSNSIKDKIHSEPFLQELIRKYDLYKSERIDNINEKRLTDRLRDSIRIEVRDWQMAEGIQTHLWISFRKENAEHIKEISNDVGAQFERIPDFQVNKIFSEPYDANPYREYVFWGGVMQGLVMLVIPLILIWEIPNIFYSPKTKEAVFEPLKSDWQNELNEAKLRKQTWKSFEINLRYRTAFLSALAQKSPIGDLIEYVRKIAG